MKQGHWRPGPDGRPRNNRTTGRDRGVCFSKTASKATLVRGFMRVRNHSLSGELHLNTVPLRAATLRIRWGGVQTPLDMEAKATLVFEDAAVG